MFRHLDFLFANECASSFVLCGDGKDGTKKKVEIWSRFRKFTTSGSQCDWPIAELTGESRVVASEFRGVQIHGVERESSYFRPVVMPTPPIDSCRRPVRWRQMEPESPRGGVQYPFYLALHDLKRRHVIVRRLPGRFPGRSLPGRGPPSETRKRPRCGPCVGPVETSSPAHIPAPACGSSMRRPAGTANRHRSHRV